MMLKIAFLVLLFAAASAAFTIRRHRSLHHFDLDGNGHVERSELRLMAILYTFRAVDKNGDETITKEELTDYFTEQGYETDLADRLVKGYFIKHDSDSNDKLGLLEFLHYGSTTALYASAEEINEAFRAYDKNGNGLLTEDELRRSIVAPEVASLAGLSILGLDKDGDWMVNFEEFTEGLKKAKY